MSVTAFPDVFRRYDQVFERLAALGPAGDSVSTMDLCDALTIEQCELAMEIAQLTQTDAKTLSYQAKVVLDFCSGEHDAGDLAARALARHILRTNAGV